MTAAIMQGVWNDGRTAASHPVEVEVEAQGLSLRTADGLQVAQWPAQQVRLADTMPDGRFRLRLDDGSLARLRLGAEHRAAVEQACINLRRRDLNSGWRLRPVFAWSIAAAIGFLLSLFVLIPWAAEIAAHNMSVESERKFGEHTRKALHHWLAVQRKSGEGSLLCTDEGGRATLDLLMQRLTTEQPTRVPLSVEVINVPMINAFALPGGYIIVTQGLLQYVEHEGELIGVLAHEIGHVEARHNLSGMVKRGAAGFLIGLFFGDAVGGLASIGMADALLNAAYSRDMEAEADALAIQRLLRAGFNPGMMQGFFARLAEKEREGLGYYFTMVSSHPASAERASQFAAAAQPGQSIILTSGQWFGLKAICSRLRDPIPRK